MHTVQNSKGTKGEMMKSGSSPDLHAPAPPQRQLWLPTRDSLDVSGGHGSFPYAHGVACSAVICTALFSLTPRLEIVLSAHAPYAASLPHSLQLSDPSQDEWFIWLSPAYQHLDGFPSFATVNKALMSLYTCVCV